MVYREPQLTREDALQCVTRLRGDLQKIIRTYRNADALMWGMSTCFAQLLQERGGDNQPFLRTRAMFAQFRLDTREKAKECHTDVQALVADVRAEGFALDTVLWAIMGAILNIMGGLGHSQQEIDQAMTDMITRINEARRLSVQ